MRLLLDTHTFIWLLTDTDRLPAITRSAIVDTENEVAVSAVSFWEIAIKVSRKRIEPLGREPSSLVEAAKSMGLIPVPLLPLEAATQGLLAEATHFDPFDRMLIWQAIQSDLTLISRDPEFRKFESEGLRLLWK